MTVSTTALQTALRFSPADLQANRQGKLSQRQAARMLALRRRNSALAAPLFLLLVCAATALLYGGQVGGNRLLSGTGFGLIVLNALLSGFVGRSWMRIGSDLRAGAVEVLAGDVERVLRRGRAGDNYLLRIDGASLFVSREVFRGFEHEAPYHIYRTSHARVLLSAEPVDWTAQLSAS